MIWCAVEVIVWFYQRDERWNDMQSCEIIEKLCDLTFCLFQVFSCISFWSQKKMICFAPIVALTFDTQMTINHVCPAFWLGLCLVGIGLCSLMLGYRDREDLREGEKKRRPSKARIGYYIFLIASILIMAVIITTHVAALFIKDPSLRMDIVVVLFRLLLLTTVSPSLLAIWLLYQRFGPARCLASRNCDEIPEVFLWRIFIWMNIALSQVRKHFLSQVSGFRFSAA